MQSNYPVCTRLQDSVLSMGLFEYYQKNDILEKAIRDLCERTFVRMSTKDIHTLFPTNVNINSIEEDSVKSKAIVKSIYVPIYEMISTHFLIGLQYLNVLCSSFIE